MTNSYRIRLQSDEELISRAITIYEPSLTNKTIQLDDSIFGATISDNICSVCNCQIKECPGHYSVLKLIYPIPKVICFKDFIQLIPLLCTKCSSLLCDNITEVYSLPKDIRFKWIRDKCNSYTKNSEISVICPYCKEDIQPMKVFINEPPSFRVGFTVFNSQNFDQLNPIFMYQVLQNFHQLEECGFSKYYHPKNFMTQYIPLVPNKLRPKGIIGLGGDSMLTSYYLNIINVLKLEMKEIFKTLMESDGVVIPRGNILNRFNDAYDKIYANYDLLTNISPQRVKEVSLSKGSKKDKSQYDVYNSLIGRFKGKEKSMFNKGVVATRHDISARTVLGGAVDSRIKQINVPYHIASKLSVLYPVYRENIHIVRQIIKKMSIGKKYNNTRIIKPLYIMFRNGGKNGIKTDNADILSSMISPGDKIALSLTDTDFVMQSRFPSVREESWSSFQVKRDNNTIITIPLSDCEMKMADFDGDEGQIYVHFAHYTDFESLLLHSPTSQYIAYKDGNPAIWFPWTGDAAYGLGKIKQGAKCIIKQGQLVEEYSVIEYINEHLPNDLNYSDKTLEIKSGKLISELTNFRNAEFFKYYSTLYSNAKAQDLMDILIQLAYDLNINYGCTLGYNIKVYGEGNQEKINEIKEETMNELREIESSNDPNKVANSIIVINKNKTRIKEILLNAAKGTDLETMGYTKLRQEEYYQTTIALDPVDRPPEINRVNSAFTRFTINPRCYGYNDKGYKEDISPISHFYETKQQRFALFQKGQGTANQGYMSKKLGVTYGNNYLDANGSVVNSFRILSFVYGNCGLNPRLSVKQPLIDILLPENDFMKKYSGDTTLIELYKKINYINERYSYGTLFIKNNFREDMSFIAGFDYLQFIKSYSKKGITPENVIEEIITSIRSIYCPETLEDKHNLENLIHHEYFFRIISKEYDLTGISSKLIELFMWTLANGGDTVGMKAALATSEPLTQASLHAIHHAGGGGADVERVVRSMGLARFEELLSGNRPKNVVITIKLYDDSYENCKLFANEQETFFIKDIWSKTDIYISKSIPEIILQQTPDLRDIIISSEINPYYVTSIWDMSIISSYGIHFTDIFSRIMSNNKDIFFMSAIVLNSSEIMVYIFFVPSISSEDIIKMIETWGSGEKASNVVHGQYLKNCYVTENKNNPGHYLIEANEVKQDSNVLREMIYLPEVDPIGCKSTNPKETYDIFGVLESSTRHYEDLIYTAANLSDTKGVLQRHYKILSDTTYANGEPRYATRSHLKSDNAMDIFRLVQFETAKDMIQEKLKQGETFPVSDPVSASLFGDLPTMGTGCSNYIIYNK